MPLKVITIFCFTKDAKIEKEKDWDGVSLFCSHMTVKTLSHNVSNHHTCFDVDLLKQWPPLN